MKVSANATENNSNSMLKRMIFFISSPYIYLNRVNKTEKSRAHLCPADLILTGEKSEVRDRLQRHLS